METSNGQQPKKEKKGPPQRRQCGSLPNAYAVIKKPKDNKVGRASCDLVNLQNDLATELLGQDKNKNNTNSNNEVPIPRGNSAYAKAKRAEYLEKNLGKAEKFYRIAIKNGERLESSIKDLATVLHQQGKTDEACKFLEENRQLVKKNKTKYDNLLLNLKKQIVPSGNFLNRTLALFNVPENYDEKRIRELFGNDSRIGEIEFIYDNAVDKIFETYKGEEPLPHIIIKKACLLRFASNSAARKTLETLIEQNQYRFYWMNVNNELISKAEVFKVPPKEDANNKSMTSDQDDTALTAESSAVNNSFSQREKGNGGMDSPSNSFKTDDEMIMMSPLVKMGSIPEMQEELETHHPDEKVYTRSQSGSSQSVHSNEFLHQGSFGSDSYGPTFNMKQPPSQQSNIPSFSLSGSNQNLFADGGWNSCLLLMTQNDSPERSLSPVTVKTSSHSQQETEKFMNTIDERDICTIFNKMSRSSEFENGDISQQQQQQQKNSQKIGGSLSPVKKPSIFGQKSQQMQFQSSNMLQKQLDSAAVSGTNGQKLRHSCNVPFPQKMWDQVTIKQRETKSMIAEDPNFVQKLLAKYIEDK